MKINETRESFRASKALNKKLSEYEIEQKLKLKVFRKQNCNEKIS